MDKDKTHIINRVFLEINTNSTEYAYFLKDNLNSFLKEEVFPYLETCFNDIDASFIAESLQIEKLNVNLSIRQKPDLRGLKLEIKEKIRQNLEKQLAKTYLQQESNGTFINPEQKLINSFFHFFENGTKTWYNKSEQLHVLENKKELFELLENKTFVNELKFKLKKTQFRERFIRQLSNQQIQDILKTALIKQPKLYPTEIFSIKNFHKKAHEALFLTVDNITTDKFYRKTRNLYYEILILYLLEEQGNLMTQKLIQLFTAILQKKENLISPDQENVRTSIIIEKNLSANKSEEIILHPDKIIANILKDLQKNIESESYTQKFKFKSNPEETKTGGNYLRKTISTISGGNFSENDHKQKDLLPVENLPEEPSGYFIENTGLILIHPFLKQLFKNCELLDDNKYITDPELAVHLLHFVATKKEQQYEDTMVFEKFLCNIPSGKPINRAITLSDEVKQHAEDMLKAMTQHWPAMKTASTELLRNEFLQRPGKLILTENNPKIIVEKKTQDILLEKITWNISMVKLPWKEKIMFVDW